VRVIDRVAAAVGRRSDVHDWTIRRRQRRVTQLYLAGDEVESLREVRTDDLELEVCNDHPAPQASEVGDRVRGTASMRLVPDDLAVLETRIEEAVLMASLVHNPPYQLANPSDYPPVPIADPALESGEAALRAALEAGEQIRAQVAAEREAGVRLSAAELFLGRTELEVWTSRGVRATGTATDTFAELVLLAAGDGQEAEHFRQLRARRLADMDLGGNLRQVARFARDSLQPGEPPTRTGPVVVSGQALLPMVAAPEMFGSGPFLIFQASAAAAHARMSRLEVGAPITGERPVSGEPLTFRVNALRPYGLASHAFDDDGLPGQDVAVVKDGVLVARPATLRYAQYLGIPATGQAGNLEIPAGSTPIEELLRDGPLCHVVAFSAPNIDAVTGDLGMEIRLGYEIGANGARPVKGGSVTGNLLAALADARFSSETMAALQYRGPLAVRFGELTVAGGA
jgi:predicted Zn-dependent protease